jgi:hypothetical protein
MLRRSGKSHDPVWVCPGQVAATTIASAVPAVHGRHFGHSTEGARISGAPIGTVQIDPVVVGLSDVHRF